MINFLLIIHAIIALLLITLVLLQKSEGGALGIGGSSGGLGSMFSMRGSSNILTRTTAILATLFMLNSLLLAILFSKSNNKTILDQLDKITPTENTEPLPNNQPTIDNFPNSDQLKPFNDSNPPLAPKAQ